MSYAQYMHRVYDPPFACLQLIQERFAERGIRLDKSNDSNEAELDRLLFGRCKPVGGEPQADDIILLRSAPWHVGLMINATQFIHVFIRGHPARGSIDSPIYRDRIRGIYRYVG